MCTVDVSGSLRVFQEKLGALEQGRMKHCSEDMTHIADGCKANAAV